jgi:hypothetical protein
LSWPRSPLVEISEDDREHLVKAELPELKKEDVKMAMKRTEPTSAKRNTLIEGSGTIISLWLTFEAIASLFAADQTPPGASAVGCSNRIINEHPVAADIAPGGSGNYKWFSGQWYAKPPSLDHYTTTNGVLTLSLGGDLVSVPRDFSPGILPTLPGDQGFYVEFDVRLSDNDPDHFPAVWLMPVEHNQKMLDVYPSDPAGFERWMELDGDEGGFGPGLTGTVHDWRGIYPNLQHSQNPNNVSNTPLDRAYKHSFGVSFDPAHKRATWWVDGVKQHSAEPPYVPAVGVRQHFYLILSAQSHGKQLPYSMSVSGVRAYVPPSSTLPPK